MVGTIQQLEYSIHTPNEFIEQNLCRILPAWDCPVQSVLIVLQRSPCPLHQRTAETERWKEHLRRSFFTFAEAVASQLHVQGHRVEIFEPRSGLPTVSRSGELCLSDVATAHALLHYPIFKSGGCTLLMHPQWGVGVYPSTLVSSARPAQLSAAAIQAYRQLGLG